MNGRAQRGLQIHAAGGQIRRISDTTYAVRSQTMPDTRYMLTRTAGGWDCSCPDDVPYCKHAHALEARLGAKARADRALLMHNMGGQVERIADDHYIVKSQSSDQTYEVCDFGHGWMCSCPDHLHTAAVCKHIQAVQWHNGERHMVERPDPTACWYCDSTNTIRKGMQAGHRRFRCKSCGSYYTDNLGFEGSRASPEHIIAAVDMMFSGLSSRKTAKSLRRAKCAVTHQTVVNWARRFGSMMEQYLDIIRPHVGELWRTDEVYMKIRGERKYLFAMLDSDTRYWIARQVATNKGTDDVRPMFRKARQVAGKTPSKLISDGASNFAEAHRDEYAPRNYLWKDSVHEPHIRMDGDPNNNQMESFNGNTLRMREKVTRGLKSEDSAILAGLQIYHNHVRPHLGLPDGQTPGEAAGIRIEGDDKWLTLILAAAKAKAAAKAMSGAEPPVD